MVVHDHQNSHNSTILDSYTHEVIQQSLSARQADKFRPHIQKLSSAHAQDSTSFDAQLQEFSLRVLGTWGCPFKA